MYVLKNKFLNRVLRKINMMLKYRYVRNETTSWIDKSYRIDFEDGGSMTCDTQQEVATVLKAAYGDQITQAAVSKSIKRNGTVYVHIPVARVYEIAEPKKVGKQ